MKNFLKSLMLAVCFGHSLPMVAQVAPRDVIPVVSTGGPGGYNAMLIIGLQDTMIKITNAPMPIEYKPGGNGAVAMAHLMSTGSDRNMLGVTAFFLNPKFNYLTDSKPVIHLGESSMIVYSRPEFKGQSLVSLLSTRPKLTIGSSNVNTLEPVVRAVKQNYPNLDVVPVYFKGGGEVITAVLGGHIDLGINPAPGLLSHIEQGNLIPIINISPYRSPMLPNVPTLKDQNINWQFDRYVFLSWFILASSGTDDQLVKKLKNGVTSWLQTAEGKAFLTKHDLPLDNRTVDKPEVILTQIYR